MTCTSTTFNSSTNYSVSPASKAGISVSLAAESSTHLSDNTQFNSYYSSTCSSRITKFKTGIRIISVTGECSTRLSYKTHLHSYYSSTGASSITKCKTGLTTGSCTKQTFNQIFPTTTTFYPSS